MQQCPQDWSYLSLLFGPSTTAVAKYMQLKCPEMEKYYPYLDKLTPLWEYDSELTAKSCDHSIYPPPDVFFFYKAKRELCFLLR